MSIITANVNITNNSGDVIDAKNEAVARALEAIGLQAEANAKMEITTAVYDTPESPNYVRTGRLRNSISHAADENTAYVGTNVEYAPYVELGTSKMPARPYLQPAIMNHLDEYKQIAERELRGE